MPDLRSKTAENCQSHSLESLESWASLERKQLGTGIRARTVAISVLQVAVCSSTELGPRERHARGMFKQSVCGTSRRTLAYKQKSENARSEEGKLVRQPIWSSSGGINLPNYRLVRLHVLRPLQRKCIWHMQFKIYAEKQTTWTHAYFQGCQVGSSWGRQ